MRIRRGAAPARARTSAGRRARTGARPTFVSLVPLLLAAALAAPPRAAAQLPGGQASAGWPAPEVGVRVGYDNGQRHEVAGAMLRVPVLPGGQVELLPSVDVTFLRGFREYQYSVEAAYLTGGREGGIYAGGGIGLRSTTLPSEPAAGRQSITTYNIVVGVKFGGLERLSPVVEFRRVFTSELAVDPQLVTLGVTIALW